MKLNCAFKTTSKDELNDYLSTIHSLGVKMKGVKGDSWAHFWASIPNVQIKESLESLLSRTPSWFLAKTAHNSANVISSIRTEATKHQLVTEAESVNFSFHFIYPGTGYATIELITEPVYKQYQDYIERWAITGERVIYDRYHPCLAEMKLVGAVPREYNGAQLYNISTSLNYRDDWDTYNFLEALNASIGKAGATWYYIAGSLETPPETGHLSSYHRGWYWGRVARQQPDREQMPAYTYE